MSSETIIIERIIEKSRGDPDYKKKLDEYMKAHIHPTVYDPSNLRTILSTLPRLELFDILYIPLNI